MSHTPTPWSRNIPPAAKYNCIYSGRNKHVLYLCSSGMDEAEVEANAEFLLRAVNSHDDLVKALEPFTKLLQDHNSSGADDRPIFAINDALITLGDLRAARAALAKANPRSGKE